MYAPVNTGKTKKHSWLQVIYGIRVSYFWLGIYHDLKHGGLLTPLGDCNKPFCLFSYKYLKV